MAKKKKKPADVRTTHYPFRTEVRTSTGETRAVLKARNLEEFTKDIKRLKLDPARIEKQLAGQIKDSKHARELQKKAAEERRQVAEFEDTVILQVAEFGDTAIVEGISATWHAYWKAVWDKLPPGRRSRKTADQRTADAFSCHPSTIKRRRLQHPELSKL